MQNLSHFPVDVRLSEYILSYGSIAFNEPESTQVITSPNGLTGFLIRTSHSDDFEISQPILKEIQLHINLITLLGKPLFRFWGK